MSIDTTTDKTPVGPVGALAPLAVPIDTLDYLPGNPRRGDVPAVAASLTRFGQRKPIVAKRDGTVIAGNHTLEAARSLGWETIAVVYVDDDDATAKAFALADNRTAELGSYDDEALAELIAAVRDADEVLYGATGWTDADLDELVAKIEANTEVLEPVDPDAVPDTAPAITVPGDLWLLGDHRVLCGDCRVITDVDRLLDGAQVNLAVTSPPYAEQRTYDETSGFKPIPPDEYVAWFEAVAANVAAHLADDGSWLVNIKEHADEGQRVLYVKDLVLAHVRDWRWRFIDEFCWDRGGVPGKWPNRFKNGWEPVFHFSRSPAIKFRPDAVAHQSDGVFEYDRNNGKAASGSGLLGTKAHGYEAGMALPSNVLRLKTGGGATGSHHPAAFPAAMPAWFIQAFTDRDDVIYDPFAGSGSTIIAAEQQHRRGYGIEISPGYVDIICRRYQQHTGTLPINATTGKAHDFCA